MCSNNNNNKGLTARLQPDIYAILSTDETDTTNATETIDTNALVKNIFDNTGFTTYEGAHPLSVTSTSNNSVESNSQFPTSNSPFLSNNFNQDLINFEFSASHNSQYTPPSEVNIDPLFNNNHSEEDSMFLSFNPPASGSSTDSARRHSVAVSGGIADFNLRNLSQSFEQQLLSSNDNENLFKYNVNSDNSHFIPNQPHLQPQLQPQRPQYPSVQISAPHALYSRDLQHQKLATVVEGEAPFTNANHRASMPNIFLPEESRRQLAKSIQRRAGSISTNATPNSTPPPDSITFNQMPWLTTNDEADSNNHDWTDINIKKENHNDALTTSFAPNSAQPLLVGQQQQPFRKRFYSQQFDSLPTPPLPFNNLQGNNQQQPSNLCPLPMSGVPCRRTSMASPNDIYVWNKMVTSQDRNSLTNPSLPQQVTHHIQPISNSLVKELSPMNVTASTDNTTTAGKFNNPNFASNSLSSNNDITPRASTAISATVKHTRTTGKKRARTNDVDQDDTAGQLTEVDYPNITDADLEAAKKDPNAIPRRQKLRFEGDEYTPKWVRYTGQSKEGYCDTCQPGKWLQLKNSAFWYHKQFFHGISSVSGRPFQRPLEQRATGEHDVIEGLCHQCKQFVPICNSKRKNSVLWYRHAHKCHIYDKPKTNKAAKRASIVASSRKYQLNDQMQKTC